MNLRKAIEKLTGLVDETSDDMDADDFQAMKLGIEAMELVDGSRCTLNGVPVFRLPGETEE